MTQQHANQVEESINLRRQVSGLSGGLEQDLIFQDTSPPRRYAFVYATDTGEPIRVPVHRLEAVLSKRLPSGEAAFTTHEDQVPEYRLGTVKCFLARGSEERALVDEMNISNGYYCVAEHLMNEGAAIDHAEHKHPSRWRRYKEALDRREREADRLERRNQTEAMLALATGKAKKET